MTPEKDAATMTFLGGTETVTGSKTLLESDTARVMVDCGLFQGLKKLRRLNWRTLPVSVEEIDHVVLTHGHLDHVGYLPRLVREGFTGTIHATAPTVEVAKIILMDSAKIQEEDARRANEEGYTEHDPARPLYSTRDAKETFQYFRKHEPGDWIDLDKSFRVRFRPNGHILGSTLIEVDVRGHRLVFSGDLGRPESLLHKVPQVPDQVDSLVLESTYGDRLHVASEPADQLQSVIEETAEKEGNLLIPSFALGRAQELMYLLNELKKKQRIEDYPVYLDSPMGVNITELYRKFSEWHTLVTDECSAMCEGVELIRDFERTREVVNESGTKIIIAGSGMLSGGRILFYLKRMISDPATTVLLTGFQAEGTRGRMLQRGAHELKFYGNYHPVRADVRELTNLSAHADQGEILEWLHRFPETPDRVLLNHGEPQASQALRVKISDELDWDVDVASSHQSVQIAPHTNEGTR